MKIYREKIKQWCVIIETESQTKIIPRLTFAQGEMIMREYFNKSEQQLLFAGIKKVLFVAVENIMERTDYHVCNPIVKRPVGCKKKTLLFANCKE